MGNLRGRMGVFCVTLILVLLPGCGKRVETKATLQSGSDAGSDASSNKSHPSSSQTPTEGSRNQNGSEPSENPAPYSLVVNGGFLQHYDLYTLALGAREDVPFRFVTNTIDFMDLVSRNQPGKILSLTRRRYGSRYSIHLVNLATQRAYQSFEAQEQAVLSDLDVSPDGNWAVFLSKRRQHHRWQQFLISLNVETDQFWETPVRNETLSKPKFNQDGTALFIERRTDTRSEIASVLFVKETPIDLTRSTSLLDGPLEDNFSDYLPSPDGKKVLFRKNVAGMSRLFIQREDTSILSVSDENESAFEPSWSRDGQEVVYWTENRNEQSVQSFDLLTESKTLWSHIVVKPETQPPAPRINQGKKVCPLLSPDRNQVFFTSNTGYWDHIFSVRRSDKSKRLLTDARMTDSYHCPRFVQAHTEAER